LRGIVAPHIDFPRGGHAYAHAYLELARHGRPKTVILFGVAHSSPPVPFALTRKGFDTPFGVVKTNIEFVDRLAQVCAWNPFEDELVHRTEHSIEFQAVMLAYLYGPNIEIVPILCGQFTDDPFLTDAAELSEVTAFLDVCRELAAPPESRVTVIAGADLAHVGKRFGDPFDITDGIVGQVGGRDRQDLEHVTRLEPEAFYRSVMRDRNQRKVCGHGAIYSLLKTVQGSAQSARLLCYDYAPDPAGGIVSFASVVVI
jgi:hypothetical protein